ncbi:MULTISPECIES: hypothetical protein [Bacillus]|uniref:hypothetical protein n=1 Tax=Bacillus TaxID=1386 RepID=UPI000B444132|nr:MULTISPECIES: hypothetical protein [Bacillus]MED1303810.1 hypothetical protein [Bacillus pacificus]OUB10723.1 hypothetical protein BK704_11680 [[Bacillus thuringiensis] serovar konkukian]PFW05337.1 hypothetical protein COL22_23330 [Bacillus thuringiensis]QEQ20772.1 hypothetical protein F0362_30005 [Bacillus sp. BS98]
MPKKKNSSFLKFVTSRGKLYVYLAKEIYIRKENGKNISKTKTLYGFGRYDIALERLYCWREDPETFPEELKGMNYNWFDINDWVLTLETGYSKTGRKLSALARL